MLWPRHHPTHPLLGPCKVTAIDYSFDIIKLVPLVDSLSPSLLQKLISRTVPIDVVRGLYHQSPCDIYAEVDAILVCCSRELAPSLDAVGPISFLSNTTHLLYLVPAHGLMSNYMSDCVLVSDDIVQIPLLSEGSYRFPYLNISVTRLLSSAELPQRLEQDLGYNYYYFGGDSCSYCERKGRLCAFSSQRNQTFCMPHGSRIKVIAGMRATEVSVMHRFYCYKQKLKENYWRDTAGIAGYDGSYILSFPD